MKAGSTCCKLPFKTTEVDVKEEEEEGQAAVNYVCSLRVAASTLTMVLILFLGEKDVFSWLPAGFWQGFSLSLRHVTGCHVAALIGNLEFLPTDSSSDKKSDWTTLNVIDRWFVQSPPSLCLKGFQMFSVGSIPVEYVR